MLVLTEEEYLEIPYNIRNSIEDAFARLIRLFDYSQFLKRPFDTRLKEEIRYYVLRNVMDAWVCKFDQPIRLLLSPDERIWLRHKIPPFDVKLTLQDNRSLSIQLIFPLDMNVK